MTADVEQWLAAFGRPECREKDSGAGAQHERKLAVAGTKRLEEAAWHCGTRECRNAGAGGHVGNAGQILHNAALCEDTEANRPFLELR